MLTSETFAMIEDTRSKHEFLTFLVMENDLKVGIIQNETPKLIHIFDFQKIREEALKKRFLAYADQWWWGSNQTIPVDSYIGEPFDEFYNTLTGYPKKAITQIIGPTFSLHDHLKRVKKKKIEILNRTIPTIV